MKMNKQYTSKSMQTADRVGEIIGERCFLKFTPRQSVEHIVREMQKHHQGAVGIVDTADRLIGLVTERDILRKIFGADDETVQDWDQRQVNLSRLPGKLTAWDVLIPDPKCLEADMPVEDALEIIKGCGFRYMPVITQDGRKKLLGIVSERELFWYTQDKIRRIMEQKDNLLSYFMHHEPYGAGVNANEKTF